MNTCNTCHWFKPHASGNPHYNGECERHAPIAAVVRDFVATIWPEVAPTDRCGEWRSKDTRSEGLADDDDDLGETE